LSIVAIVLLSIVLATGVVALALLIAVYQTFDHPRETLRGFFTEDLPRATVQKQPEPELKGVNILA
tara:strand:- start:72 stop:269 length:198 start_codon:yes stop_codon:yes gene_type:complete